MCIHVHSVHGFAWFIRSANLWKATLEPEAPLLVDVPSWSVVRCARFQRTRRRRAHLVIRPIEISAQFRQCKLPRQLSTQSCATCKGKGGALCLRLLFPSSLPSSLLSSFGGRGVFRTLRVPSFCSMSCVATTRKFCSCLRCVGAQATARPLSICRGRVGEAYGGHRAQICFARLKMSGSQTQSRPSWRFCHTVEGLATSHQAAKLGHLPVWAVAPSHHNANPTRDRHKIGT